MKIFYRALRIRRGEGIFHNIRRQLCGKIFTRARNSYTDLKLSWATGGGLVFGRPSRVRLSIFSFHFRFPSLLRHPSPTDPSSRFPRISISPRKCQIPYTDRNILLDREPSFFADTKYANVFFLEILPATRIHEELTSYESFVPFLFASKMIKLSVGVVVQTDSQSWVIGWKGLEDYERNVYYFQMIGTCLFLSLMMRYQNLASWI